MISYPLHALIKLVLKYYKFPQCHNLLLNTTYYIIITVIFRRRLPQVLVYFVIFVVLQLMTAEFQCSGILKSKSQRTWPPCR
jgi:hypothetical protein